MYAEIKSSPQAAEMLSPQASRCPPLSSKNEEAQYPTRPLSPKNEENW